MVHTVMPIKSPVIVNILRIAFIFGMVLLPGLYASGQVKFTTVVSSQDVGKSDYLQVEFVVENAKQIDEMNPPDFAGFRVAQGPIQSSGMSIVNGNMSQYKALSFVLEPIKTGKFTIGGATATVDGKHMQSNAVTVTVHPGGSGSAGSSPQPSQSPFGGNPFGGNPFFQPSMPDPFGSDAGDVDRDYVLKPGENPKDKIKKGLFVKVLVDKNSCYVGEPIVATYKLYTRVSSESRITKQPSLNGFSVYDMIDPSQDAVSVERLNGKNYTVHTIRKAQLIPLQSGTIDLDQVEVDNTVHFVKSMGHGGGGHGGNSIRDLLDAMTDEGGYGPEVDEKVTLDTKPLPITVKPLPDAGKPAGFNGAVGSFSVEASVDHKSLAADDEATLHLVVKGKGNLPMITAPVVNWPSGFTAFDPTAKEDVNKTVAPMAGSKSFDYVFTPDVAGHYTIPQIDFPYFDPASQTYKTAETQPMDIQVTPAVRSHSKPADKATAKQAPPAGIMDYARDYGMWMAAFLLLGAVAAYFWRQNRKLKKASREEKVATVVEQQNRVEVERAAAIERIAAAAAANAHTDKSNSPVREVPLQKDRDRERGRDRERDQDRDRDRDREERIIKEPVLPPNTYVSTAPPADPLQEARHFFEREDPKGFYREVNRALWKAMSKKLGLPASELNKANSLRQLQLRGWDDTALMTLENLFNECEMNLYTPAYDRWNMQQLLRQAEWVLDRLA